MCEPMAGAVASGLSSVAGFAADSADYDAKAEQWRQNFTNAHAAGVDSQKQLNLRMTQEAEAYVQRRHLTEIEGAEAVAKAEVGGGNISGNAISNLIVGLNRSTANNQMVLKTNYQSAVAQLQKQNEATNTEIMNRVNSIQVPTAPSPLGAIASGIGGVLKAMPQQE